MDKGQIQFSRSRSLDETAKTVCTSASADVTTTLTVTLEAGLSSTSSSLSTSTSKSMMSIQESSRFINNYFNFNQCEVKIYAQPDKM